MPIIQQKRKKNGWVLLSMHGCLACFTAEKGCYSYRVERRLTLYLIRHLPIIPVTFRRAPLGSTKVKLIKISLTDGEEAVVALLKALVRVVSSC